MAVRHDLQCMHCGECRDDVAVSNPDRLPRCPSCYGPCEIRYSAAYGRAASVHASERTVVWRHPGTGKVAYPPMNNVPMPARYARAGYERYEMDSSAKVAKFEKEHKVINEKAHYNSGNGIDT